MVSGEPYREEGERTGNTDRQTRSVKHRGLRTQSTKNIGMRDLHTGRKRTGGCTWSASTAPRWASSPVHAGLNLLLREWAHNLCHATTTPPPQDPQFSVKCVTSLGMDDGSDRFNNRAWSPSSTEEKTGRRVELLQQELV